MNRRRFLEASAAYLGLELVGCGGGVGGSPALSPLPVSPPRTTAPLFGYYYLNSVSVLEVAGHTNCVWAAGTYPAGILEQIATLQMARGAGVKSTVIDVPIMVNRSQAASELRVWLKRLDDLGLLAAIRMVYVGDEVNDGRFTEDQVRELVRTARGVMREFTALSGAAVCTSYVVDKPYIGLTGPDAPDWVGLTAYHYECGATLYYDDIIAKMDARQQLVIFPGGSDGLGKPRQEPGCYVSYALAQSRVAMVAPYAWQTIVDRGNTYVGIREDASMRAKYIAAGLQVIG